MRENLSIDFDDTCTTTGGDRLLQKALINSIVIIIYKHNRNENVATLGIMAISRYENCTHRCHVIILINNSKHFHEPNIFNMRTFCSQQWLGGGGLCEKAPITIIIAAISVMMFKYIQYYTLYKYKIYEYKIRRKI